MKNKLLLVTTLLTLTSLAGCCEKNEECSHQWGDWSTKTDATCTEEGERTRTCTLCNEIETSKIDVLDHDWADATCTSPKTCKECSATDGNALGHTFGTATYNWNNTSCTASRACTRGGCTYAETETVTGTYVKDSDATCTAAEKGHYVAVFENNVFTNQVSTTITKGNQLEHTFGATTYSWSGDSCTASRPCTRSGCTYAETETVKGTYVKDSDATCTEAETGHYVADFKNAAFTDQVTETAIHGNPAEHLFGNVTYEWKGSVCKAKRACTRSGCTYVEMETATGTYVKDSDATCTSPEKGHYVANFENTSFTQQVSNSVDVGDALNHSYNYKGECTRTGCNASIKVQAQYSDDGEIYYIEEAGLKVYELNANGSLHIKFVRYSDGSDIVSKIYDEDGNVLLSNSSYGTITLTKNQKIYVSINCIEKVGSPYFTIECDHSFDEYGYCSYCEYDDAELLKINGYSYSNKMKNGTTVFKFETDIDTYGQLVFAKSNGDAVTTSDSITFTVTDMSTKTPVTVYKDNKFVIEANAKYRISVTYSLTASTTLKVSLNQTDIPVELKEKAFIIDDVFLITDKGICLSGTVLSGIVQPGDELYVYNLSAVVTEAYTVEVTGLEITKNEVDSAVEGQTVGIYIDTDRTKEDFVKSSILSNVEYTIDDAVTEFNFDAYFYSKQDGGRSTPATSGYMPSVQFTFTAGNKVMNPINLGTMKLNFDGDTIYPSANGQFVSGTIYCNTDTSIKWLPGDLFDQIVTRVVVTESGKTIGDLYISESDIDEQTIEFKNQWKYNTTVIRDGYFVANDKNYSTMTNLYKGNVLSNFNDLLRVSFLAKIDTTTFDEGNGVGTFDCTEVYMKKGFTLTIPSDVNTTYIGMVNYDNPEFDIYNYSIFMRYTNGNVTTYKVSGITEVNIEFGCVYIVVL